MQLVIAFLFWYFWTTASVVGIASTVLLSVWYITQRLYEMYVAVMALRDRRNEGSLSQMDQVFGRVALVRGLMYDAVVNTTVCTLLFVELPKWASKELIATPRLKRLAKLPASSKGLAKWRRRLSRWLLGQIDQHDKSGGHDVPDSVN
jgi:hypothetical protein